MRKPESSQRVWTGRESLGDEKGEVLCMSQNRRQRIYKWYSEKNLTRGQISAKKAAKKVLGGKGDGAR